MSDLRLRELERRWRETGSVTDEAAFLAEQVRTGDLPRDRLALAAYVGHEAAEIALGEEAGAPEGIVEWLRGLERWDRRTVVRALAAAARLALPSFSSAEEASRARAMLQAAEAWVRCPCERHAAEALDLSQHATELMTETTQQLFGDTIESVFERVLTGGLRIPSVESIRQRVLEVVSELEPANAQETAVLAVGLVGWITTWAQGVSEEPLGFDVVARVVRSLEQLSIPASSIRSGVRDELSPWALGRGDPLG